MTNVSVLLAALRLPSLLLLASWVASTKSRYLASAFVQPNLYRRPSLPIIGGGTTTRSSPSAQSGPPSIGQRIRNVRSHQSSRRSHTALTSPHGDEESEDATYTPPKFKKAEEEEKFIEDVLRSNFLFVDYYTKPTENEMEKNKDTDLSELAAAFEMINFTEGSFLCEQGDEDVDYLYIIYRGACGVFIDGKKLEEQYGTMEEGSLIGDVGMIYDKPRAATIKIETPVTAFRLHRKAFNYFLRLETVGNNDLPSSSRMRSPKERMQVEVKKIDAAIDQIAGLKSIYGGDIIQPFKPTRTWLWGRWKGTILQQSWKTACWNMLVSVTFVFTFRWFSVNVMHQPITWELWMIPSESHPLIARMYGLNRFWTTTMGLTTFILTFFLSEAYTLWRDIYSKGREIQGHLNDISLMAASRAERDAISNEYTPRATKAFEDVAGCIRLFNALLWASFVAKYRVLLTPKGLSRLLSRGVMTREQYKCLIDVRPITSAPQYAILQWIYFRLLKGCEEGAFAFTDTVEGTFTEKILDLRGSISSIRNSLEGKIPLAYAHFVQVLVDIFLLLAPFALYPELGLWSVPAVGLLTLFFGGILDLSKILLFPLQEDDDSSFSKNTSVNMDVGVLIRETNVGPNQWKSGMSKLPF
eukprot:jgi/Psemu1/191283/e_gw1.112.6.1